MKKYVFARIIYACISIFIVTTIAFVMVYRLVPKHLIFETDPTINKLKGKAERLFDYKSSIYEKLGYVDYLTTAELSTLIAGDDQDQYKKLMEGKADELFIEWHEKPENKKYDLQQTSVTNKYYAMREIPIFEQIGKFYSNLIEIDHPWKIEDPDNPDLPRHIKFAKSPEMGLVLEGSGTKHKYLLYFDKQFPFIHQNFVNINLGISYPTYNGQEVTEVISSNQGKSVNNLVRLDSGEEANVPMDMSSRTYKQTASLDRIDKKYFEDNYAKVNQTKEMGSMIKMSFTNGILALILTYAIGIPFAIMMARHRNAWLDRFCNVFVMILISVPSLAFIYFVRFILGGFGLPQSYPELGASSVKSIVAPIIILAFLSIPSIIIWVRRYMIDQYTSDYVKFARAKGLTDREIANKHILKNALIPIVNGIPAAIIMTITGATITESVFAFPGMGKMLPDSILQHNNPMIVALVFIFTTISVFSVLLGDIMLTMIDPRISFSNKENN